VKRPLGTLTTALAAILIAASAGAADAQSRDRAPRQTLFIGLDTSGSFKKAGYEDSLAFLAYYIYGHLNGLGGLAHPRDLFVAAIGGKDNDEAKAFYPIHDFAGKSITQIETDLRQWFPPTDTLTDFNAFFRQVARIVKERSLQLTPISIMLVSDGIPDVGPATKTNGAEAYRRIDLAPLEYLSRSVTVRLAYSSPPVGERWRTQVRRDRVRLWTVDYEVMRGWRTQIRPEVEPAAQDNLWKWVRENVDFRARRGT
jgi:hypothetical protein